MARDCVVSAVLASCGVRSAERYEVRLLPTGVASGQLELLS